MPSYLIISNGKILHSVILLRLDDSTLVKIFPPMLQFLERLDQAEFGITSFSLLHNI